MLSLAIGLICLLVTDALIVLTFAAMPFDRRGAIQERIFRAWARAMLRICRVRLYAPSVSAVDWSRNYIVVSNHGSLVDIPALVAGTPVPLKFLAKKELLRIPLMGTYLLRAGHIPVDRRNSRAAVQSLKDAAKILAEGGRSVLIFPEGTRSSGPVGPFREGAALLGIHSGIPILPVGIVGANKVLPNRSATLTPGPVELRFGTPVETRGLTLRDRARLTQTIRDRVVELAGD